MPKRIPKRNRRNRLIKKRLEKPNRDQNWNKTLGNTNDYVREMDTSRFEFICFQSGNCKSFLRRYHYDSSSGTCQAFIFSGCRGNKNNFETPGACHKACAPANAPDPNQATFTYLGNPCEMKKDVGKCKAKKPMFYFDAKTSLCKLFFFGGCGGNANK